MMEDKNKYSSAIHSSLRWHRVPSNFLKLQASFLSGDFRPPLNGRAGSLRQAVVARSSADADREIHTHQETPGQFKY